ncbi:unnamed protein product [Prunus armeniaca]|uniref:Uncharacterized protein n=1 Tax=Prunus armeniaca TaxID=36596 RepID=A0A6J5WBL5_PRUAR|nr:unnamed protein product [Prunus armeniaca]
MLTVVMNTLNLILIGYPDSTTIAFKPSDYNAGFMFSDQLRSGMCMTSPPLRCRDFVNLGKLGLHNPDKLVMPSQSCICKPPIRNFLRCDGRNICFKDYMALGVDELREMSNLGQNSRKQSKGNKLLQKQHKWMSNASNL